MLRLFQVKAGDNLKQLLKGADEASVQRLQALNPHLDIAKATAGTVLLLPDTPAFTGGTHESVSADAWAALASDAAVGLKARTEQLKASSVERDEQRKEVLAILKTAAVKRQLDADTGLREQAEAAQTQFKADQKAATDTAKQLDVMSKSLAEEIAALGAFFK